VTKQARGFLENVRKETDKFNARIDNGIDRGQLEATSDTRLAMKRMLLAMSDGTMLAGEEKGSRRSIGLAKGRKPLRLLNQAFTPTTACGGGSV